MKNFLYAEVAERMADKLSENEGRSIYGADIFDNPEKFMVSVYLWIASEICGTLETVNEFWNDSEELTAELIEKITEELENLYY